MDLGRSITTQSETRSGTAATIYSNPPNSPNLNRLSRTFHKAHVGRTSQQLTTPITPTTPFSPMWLLSPNAREDVDPQESTSLSPALTPTSLWPLKESERESSVIHLDIYDTSSRPKLHIWGPAQKKVSIPRTRLLLETTPGSESGSVSSLLVPRQAIYAWNDGTSQ
jgi:hypothetical protein